MNLIERSFHYLHVQTQARLGWHPTAPGLIADLEQMRYSETPADKCIRGAGTRIPLIGADWPN